MDEEALLESYAEVIEKIAESPYTKEHHQQHIAITKQLNLSAELHQAKSLQNQYFTCSDNEWLDWIQERKDAINIIDDDINEILELIELYRKAIAESLSIPLLLSYVQYFVSNYYSSLGLSRPASEDDENQAMENVSRKVGEENAVLAVVFSLDEVRGALKEASAISEYHLIESQKVWTVARDFEMDLLKMNRSQEQLARVQEMYLDRLRIPHEEIETTFSGYSRLITAYDNSKYDTLLPAANKIYAIAKAMMEEREAKEFELKKGKYYDWAYNNYIRWELEVKKPNVTLVRMLFERGVHEHRDSVDLWDGYLELLNSLPSKTANATVIAERAIKNLPSSGLVWSSYLRTAEKSKLGTATIETIFARALESKLFDDKLEELVLIYESRADYHRREVDEMIAGAEELEGDMIDSVVGILSQGIEKLGQVVDGGDPQMRLEKYLLRMFERFNRIEEAGELWDALVAARPTNYAVWYGQADFETRAGDFVRAHAVYEKGCAVKDLDYPDYLLTAWLTFEHQHGTLVHLERAISFVKVARKKLEHRRRKAARQLAASVDVLAVAELGDSVAITLTELGGAKTTSKRAREDDVVVAAAGVKKVKVDAASDEPKRDRENSTIFVVGSTETKMTEEDLKKLFRDCGPVRECKIKTIGDQVLAMIEFMEKSSIPAAQTKDKKKINDIEIEVHLAWQSCLYITNFPESFDKAAIEALFANYGVIFDTRWPSKRFNSTRKFCYVQFTSPVSAQAALELHERALEPGVKLVVYVSNPDRKQARSDVNKKNREVYISSLSKFTKENDIRKLFEPFGAIHAVRMITDERGDCRGACFVDFEDEASATASMVLNNHELKKRRIAVTIAQTRVASTETTRANELEKISRTINFKNLPQGTQEAIVQQTFEKYAKVSQVNMDMNATEGSVEFENAADAGKILLLKDSITVEDQLIDVTPAKMARTNNAKSSGKQLLAIIPATNDSKSSANMTASETSGIPGGMKPRQAGRGGRGVRGGRGGIGSTRPAYTQPRAGAAESNSVVRPVAAGGEKTQDDFRAMLSK